MAEPCVSRDPSTEEMGHTDAVPRQEHRAARLVLARLWKRRGELFRIYSDVEICLPQLSQLASCRIIRSRRSTFLRSQPPQLTSNLWLKRRAAQAGSWSNAASGVGAHELWHDRRALIRANQWQQQTNDHQFVPNLRRPST